MGDAPRRLGCVVRPARVGCWDVAAARASAASVRITIVSEATWAARFAAASRQRSHVTVVPRDRALGPLLAALARSGGAVLMSDLARLGLQVAQVPFFGQDVSVPIGPARSSVRTSAPMVLLACGRTGEFRYKVQCGPPIWPTAAHL